MRRALQLAEKGLGFCSPNPVVGCVIVHNDKIIGEGWHQKYGGPHAEVNAINSVILTELLPESTAYVTLEPCAHYGKTPPCANLLVAKRIKRVVIALMDPFPQVAGKGIEILQKAGINVTVGVLANEARWQNRRFLTQVEKKRPYIILKWAETQDRFIATENGHPLEISSSLSTAMVHRWRHEEDAILVGYGTVKTDNPSLTTRKHPGRSPLRFVLSTQKKINLSYRIFETSASTLLLTPEIIPQLELPQLTFRFDQTNMLPKYLEDISNRNVNSILVEGGTKTLNGFYQLGIWDEIRVIRSAKTLGKGIKAPAFNLPFEKLDIQLGGDEIFTAFNNQYR